MDYLITPNRSLLSVLQRQMPTLTPMSIPWSTLDQLIVGIFRVLKQHQINVTIWTKLPAEFSGSAAIDAYNQTGLVDHLYRCQQLNHTAVADLSIPAKQVSKAIASSVVPLLLAPNSSLDHEYFVLILSPRVSLFLLAQESTALTPENSDISFTEPLAINLVYSLSPALIELLLNEIKQSLALADSTPETLLSNRGLPFALPTSIDVDLLSDLLTLFWQPRTVELASPRLSAVEVPPSSGIVLTAEFLKQLTRELSLPLTKIKTALRLLDSMQNKREQRQRYLTLLQGECDRQNSVLSSLQELIELDQTVKKSDFSISLEDLVPGIVSTYQPIAAEKGITLGYTITPGLPSVTCYNHWFRQIMRHLLQNSLKYTRAQGRVNVQVDRQSNGVVLIVTDTGVGVERQDIPHLFEPFFRGRNLPTDAIEGSGLGLMVVKQLIDRCHGKIKVSSQVQKGTQIIITFPLARG